MQDSSWAPSTGRYVVADISVDPRRRTIVRPDGEFELTQRVFDLLLVFLSAPHALHTRESLFEQVWGSTCVEDANLTQSISVIRKALGEERKDWIRTLSKKGYAFEPPGDVDYIAAEAPSARTDEAAADAAPSDIRIMPPRVAENRLRPMLSRAAGATAMTFVIAALLVLPGSSSAPVTVPQQAAAAARNDHGGIGIVLVAADDPRATTTERWATALLKEWIGWKLGCLPTVSLVHEEDLIAERSTPTYFMDLKVEASPPQTGRFDFAIDVRPVYRTAADTGGNPVKTFRQTVSLAGGRDRLPTMIDAVSNGMIARMFPRRSQDRWPALALDARTARQYTDAIAAGLRHDTNATAQLRDVVAAAPDFGPARMRLAQTLAQDGQLLQAAEQAALAQRLLTPLPADAAGVLAAEAAAMAPGNADEAARSYARLYAANPTRMDFLLAQAGQLMRANQPEAAMLLLSRPQWKQQPQSLRILHRIAMSESAMALGYPDEAQANAADAINLIGHAGGDWTRELGTAQLLYARAWHQQFRTGSKPELHVRAARTFEAGGNLQGTLTAQFYEAVAGSDIVATERRMRRLLDVIRSNGDRGAEIKVLRSMAERYASIGKREHASRLRNQAYAAASLIGDVAARQLLDLDLLGEDLMSGNFEQAQTRIHRLRENRLATKYNFRVARKESALLTLQGRHREALSVLDEKLTASTRSERLDVSPSEAAKIACARMDTLLTMGELSMARVQLQGCHDSGSASVPVIAALGEAGIAYHAGDLQDARRHADEAERLLAQRPMDPGRLSMGAALAGVLTRLHDHDRAEQLYASLYPEAERMGYVLLLAEIEVGMAEIAAVRRDWNASARYAEAARRRFPVGVWSFSSRLELLDIARQSSTGDAAAAGTRASALAARAERLGDAVVQKQAAALSPAAIAKMSATEDGHGILRFATGPESGGIDWLIAPRTRFTQAAVPSRRAVARDALAAGRGR